jgi:hypothetical protein
MSHSDPQKLFIDLMKYNEENIDLLGEMQIPITNIYYFTILDQSNTEINKFISYLTDSSDSNPFETYRKAISLDEEQICQINIVKSTLKQIDREITAIIETASESSAKIVLVLDIGLLFSLINIFKETEQEIHLYDFILHKFKNKISKLFLLDRNSILKIGDKYSSVFDELNMYLSKIKPPSKNIIRDCEITIYKKHDSLYWKLLNANHKIKCIDIGSNADADPDPDADADADADADPDADADTNAKEIKNNNRRLVEIDGEEAFLLNIKLSKICFSNLFETHSNVLDPVDKLKITSIFE